MVENTGYGVRPTTPRARQRLATASIELKPNLVYSNIVAGNETEQDQDTNKEQLYEYDYINSS